MIVMGIHGTYLYTATDYDNKDSSIGTELIRWGLLDLLTVHNDVFAKFGERDSLGLLISSIVLFANQTLKEFLNFYCPSLPFHIT